MKGAPQDLVWTELCQHGYGFLQPAISGDQDRGDLDAVCSTSCYSLQSSALPTDICTALCCL